MSADARVAHCDMRPAPRPWSPVTAIAGSAKEQRQRQCLPSPHSRLTISAMSPECLRFTILQITVRGSSARPVGRKSPTGKLSERRQSMSISPALTIRRRSFPNIISGAAVVLPGLRLQTHCRGMKNESRTKPHLMHLKIPPALLAETRA